MKVRVYAKRFGNSEWSNNILGNYENRLDFRQRVCEYIEKDCSIPFLSSVHLVKENPDGKSFADVSYQFGFDFKGLLAPLLRLVLNTFIKPVLEGLVSFVVTWVEDMLLEWEEDELLNQELNP